MVDAGLSQATLASPMRKRWARAEAGSGARKPDAATTAPALDEDRGPGPDQPIIKEGERKEVPQAVASKLPLAEPLPPEPMPLKPVPQVLSNTATGNGGYAAAAPEVPK